MGAVGCALVLATLCEWGPPAVGADVLARARGFGVEHDPRRMSRRELRQLPGVGHKLALAVADARDGHRGASPLAWEDVPGIGPKRSAEIRLWCAQRGVAAEPLAAGAGIGVAERYARVMPALVRCLATSLALTLAGCRETAREGVASSDAASGSSSDATRSLALLGGALHALEAGPEAGPVVLLLHGMRYSARTWDELGTLRSLGTLGYRAVALDWPGYGATPAWEGEPDAATLLLRVADELGAERLALLGASMGGGFAFELLARAAGRVAAFVAIAPAGSQAFAPTDWSTPTLLVWGEKDPVLPLATAEALARRLRARLEVFPGAAHAAYLDQPERFHALLLEFLGASWPVPLAR